MKKAIRILSAVFLFFVIIQACKKTVTNPPPPPLPPSPSITSTNPTSGAFNNTVIISGKNFNPNSIYDSVKFNGVVAAVQSATDSTLKVTVPQGAGTGAVTVTVNNSTATGPIFTYIYTYTVSTIAGSGTEGNVDAAIGINAEFDYPNGIAVDAQGNIFVSQTGNPVGGNSTIRQITPMGTVSTLAGSSAGYINATGTSAEFAVPWGLAVDAHENIFVADHLYSHIREVTLAGVVTNYAGFSPGFQNGTTAGAQFSGPEGVAVDALGNVYVADNNNNAVRMITPSGQVSTLAGGTVGFANGTGTNAKFNNISGITCDSSGTVYVTDNGNACIRQITSAGAVTTFAGTIQGFIDSTGTNARFADPTGIAIDNKGNIYVSDQGTCIRKITADGTVTTIAGNSTHGNADGTGANAQFNFPYGLAVDAQGNVYVADRGNQRIRKITIQ
jgi:serine/threonine-protein kinase